MSEPRKRKSKRGGVSGTETTLIGPPGAPRSRRVRGDEPTLVAPMTLVVYRPVDAAELAKIEASGHRRYPRGDKTFTVLTDEAHARLATGSGWLTRFTIPIAVIDRYPKIGAEQSLEYAVPASEVETVNDAIVGPIVVMR